MKKSKYLGLVLVVAIMMMGAGYAVWDDVLVIDGTLETGNVNVEWTWNSVNPDPNGIFSATAPNPAGNSNRSSDKKTYTVKIENLYPGAEVRWTGQMTNMGSLPVKLMTFDVVKTSDVNNVADYLEVYYDTRYYDGTNWSAYNIHGWMPFSEFEAAMNSDATLKGYILKTGDRIQFGDDTDSVPNCIKFRLANNAPESLMNSTFEFDLTFTMVQAY